MPIVETPGEDMVERVGMALCQSALGGKRCPCAESGKFNCADEYPGKQARAAIAATGVEALLSENAALREQIERDKVEWVEIPRMTVGPQ